MTDDPPMQLQIPTHSDAGDHMELLNHVQKGGYEVSKEYASDHIAVYNVYPQPEYDNGMTNQANYETSNAAEHHADD